MKYRRYPGDIGSSIANTPAFPQILAKFKAPLLVENAVKNGITMMYWTCLCIGSQGRYAIDVRDLPGADTSIVDQHSRAIPPAVQRAIALLLIDAAFPDLNSLVTWCDTHAEKLTDWTNKRPQHLHKSIFIYGPQGCGKTRNARRIANHFELPNIVDDWLAGDPCPTTGALILTYETPDPDIRRQLSFQQAMVALDKPKGYPF